MAGRKGESAGTTPRQGAYEAVTERILAKLAEGTAPWQKPWPSGGRPRSMATGKPYAGINPLLTGMTALERGYTSPFWGTFEQIKAQGGMVRKGQNAASNAGATRITLWKTFVPKDAEPDPRTGEPREQVFARMIPVFNACQAEGLPAQFYPEPGDFQPIAGPQDVIDSYVSSGRAAELIFDEHGRAYYDPAADKIHMPPLTGHKTAEDFYSTAFHELAHSTGATSRLDRPGVTELTQDGHGFGSHLYGREELTAQFAASYLLADTGVDADHVMDNSAAYLASWVPVIRDDPKMLIGAASQGQKAADLILEPSREAEHQPVAGRQDEAGPGRDRQADRDIEAA